MRTLLCLLILLVNACLAADRPNWDNPAVIQVGTEKPHATMMVYPTAELARTGQRAFSPWFQSLNGTWKFTGVLRPADRPLDFFFPEYNDSAWRNMPVPSSWQLSGFDIPIYTNLIYPFPQDPKVMPTVPKEFNPVGSYRRTFTVSPAWAGRDVFLHFAGVDSAFYVWVNGVQVGYSEDSRTPAEFNITKHLKPGANTLAVQVYRFGDGAYLEDQDMWRMSGIYREVFLWSAPATHIRDFEVKAGLDAAYANGAATVKAEITRPEGCTLQAELLDGPTSAGKATTPCSAAAELSIPVPQVKKWSAESPHLYLLLLTLKDAKGATLGVIPQNVGFRTVEIRGGKVLVNGQAILVKGVNRHEHSPETAKVVDRALMIKDIELMKQFNVNSVRTSHYPNHPDWYELCDKYGLYVMDEANIEAHHYGNGKSDNLLTNSPEWSAAYLNRVERMIERDKNHPSIIFWSMGNESGDGLNAKLTYEWAKRRDPSRPWHYEGTTANGGSSADINSFMYPTPEQVKRYAAARPEMPLILCEYSHAMGNSSGGLKEYWDIFYSGTNAQGAYVWDWVDQGIWMPVPAEFKANTKAERFLAYGGWWEDKTLIRNDNNFNNNGLVSADRRPHPGLHAIKYAYRNLHASPVNLVDGMLKVKNWWNFTNAKDVAEGTWSIQRGGVTVASGRLPELDITPGAEKQFTIAMPKLAAQPGAEYMLNVSFTLKADTPWAKRGHEIAWEQFPLPANAEAPKMDVSKAAPLTLNSEPDFATVKGANFSLRFDRANGVITSYVYKGTPLIERGPRADFWRAVTDNDTGGSKGTGLLSPGVVNPETNYRIWREAAPQMTILETKADNEGGVVRFVTTAALAGMAGAKATITHTVYGSGDVIVDYAYQPGSARRPMIPRIGTELVISPGLENLTWYGRGPAETYIDRQFERTGLFKSTVNKEWVEYSKPQENGNKTDVRWVALTNPQGVGLLAIGAPLLSVGAKHFTKDDLERAAYSFMMQPHPQVFLNLDMKQMGVGGIDSWTSNAFPMTPYRIPADQAYAYRYRLTPVEGDFTAKTRERF
ncbi:MAG: DUF4981 domain-containing protein [Bryobacterales bacterium]|nr:DUF4981 domain-containing protein [Bryobacterales bacterium]